MSVTLSLRDYARTFIFHGPVGVMYAAKLAWLNWRIRQNMRFLDREKALHKECLVQLSKEFNSLIAAQQSTTAFAARYWREFGRADSHGQGEQL